MGEKEVTMEVMDFQGVASLATSPAGPRKNRVCLAPNSERLTRIAHSAVPSRDGCPMGKRLLPASRLPGAPRGNFHR